MKKNGAFSIYEVVCGIYYTCWGSYIKRRNITGQGRWSGAATICYRPGRSIPPTIPVSLMRWITKGKEHAILANTERKRVNLNAVMNALDPTDVYVESSESVNAQSTKDLIQRIIDQNPDKKTIYLISDNAQYNYARVLQGWLENKPQIVWIWLPSYSPNLNLMERLWGCMKRKILNGVYYPTYEKFKKAIQSVFQHIDHYRRELRSLMTLNLQIIDWNQSANT